MPRMVYPKHLVQLPGRCVVRPRDTRCCRLGLWLWRSHHQPPLAAAAAVRHEGVGAHEARRQRTCQRLLCVLLLRLQWVRFRLDSTVDGASLAYITAAADEMKAAAHNLE